MGHCEGWLQLPICPLSILELCQEHIEFSPQNSEQNLHLSSSHSSRFSNWLKKTNQIAADSPHVSLRTSEIGTICDATSVGNVEKEEQNETVEKEEKLIEKRSTSDLTRQEMTKSNDQLNIPTPFPVCPISPVSPEKQLLLMASVRSQASVSGDKLLRVLKEMEAAAPASLQNVRSLIGVLIESDV